MRIIFNRILSLNLLSCNVRYSQVYCVTYVTWKRTDWFCCTLSLSHLIAIGNEENTALCSQLLALISKSSFSSSETISVILPAWTSDHKQIVVMKCSKALTSKTQLREEKSKSWSEKETCYSPIMQKITKNSRTWWFYKIVGLRLVKENVTKETILKFSDHVRRRKSD